MVKYINITNININKHNYVHLYNKENKELK